MNILTSRWTTAGETDERRAGIFQPPGGRSAWSCVRTDSGHDDRGELGRDRSLGQRSSEGVAQVLIMLLIGAAASARSFTNVHDVAAAHGQTRWLAWADAVVLELMLIASGLKLRRGKRCHAPVYFRRR